MDAPATPRTEPGADWPVAITPQGRFVICNPRETIQASLLAHGQFEPLASAIAVAIAPLRPGMVVDVGANLGVFAVPVARALPGTPVLCIEPQRMVFMHLCANLLANRLRNVRVLNMAVGPCSRAGETIAVPVFDVFTERYTGSVSLDKDVQQIRGQVAGVAEPAQWASEHDRVPLVSLDAICAGAEVSFVKIDVEGMELQVLRSGADLLLQQKPTLFFEAWLLPQFEAMRRELLQHVMGLGYTVLQVGADCLAYHPQVLDGAAVLGALAPLGLALLPRG